MECMLWGEAMLCEQQGYLLSWCHSMAPHAGTPEPCAARLHLLGMPGTSHTCCTGIFLVSPSNLLFFQLPHPSLSLLTSTHETEGLNRLSPIPFLPCLKFLFMKNTEILGKRIFKRYSSLMFSKSYAMLRCW